MVEFFFCRNRDWLKWFIRWESRLCAACVLWLHITVHVTWRQGSGSNTQQFYLETGRLDDFTTTFFFVCLPTSLFCYDSISSLCGSEVLGEGGRSWFHPGMVLVFMETCSCETTKSSALQDVFRSASYFYLVFTQHNKLDQVRSSASFPSRETSTISSDSVTEFASLSCS